MSCCAGTLAGGTDRDQLPDPAGWVRPAGAGLSQLDLLVPGIHCAGCISRIERALNALGEGQARWRVVPMVSEILCKAPVADRCARLLERARDRGRRVDELADEIARALLTIA